MKFECGTYTGNGTSQTILLTMSETPDLVWIRERGTSAGRYKHGSQASTRSDRFGNSSGDTTGITAFGAGSFDLGSSTDVNESGKTNEYFVFADDSNSDFEIGTYTGDGNATQNIPISFDPEVVIVFDQGTSTEAIRLAADSAARGMTNSAAIANSITALGTNQFTVGSALNTSSRTYYYAVWKKVNDYIGTESYAGDSTTPRSVPLSDTTTAIPEFAMVWNTSSTRYVPARGDQSGSPHGVNESLGFGASSGALATDEILDFSTDSIDVGDDANVNVTGNNYVSWWLLSNPASGGGVTATASGSGSGTGSATAKVVINAVSAGSGSGTGTATATVDIQASASGSGTATGAAAATVVIVAVAAGSGSGDGAAVVTPTVTGSAAGSGSGDGTATAVVTINATASGSGSGDGTATATVQITGVASGSGGGTGAATATITISATAAGSGSGTGVVIVAGVPVVYDVTIAIAAVGAVAMGTPVAVGAVAITLGAEMYHVGDTLKITGTFTVDGTETDPTSISLQVRDPGGNIATYTYAAAQVSKESTGVYSYNLLLDEDGNWFVKWIGEGAVATATEDTKLKVERTRFVYPPA